MDQIILKLRSKLCHTNDSILYIKKNQTGAKTQASIGRLCCYDNIAEKPGKFKRFWGRLNFLVIMYINYVNCIM